ncbi:MAG: YebC/PmpR family DNA-binding transcriptional regulator [Candidatus Peribacteria bacterium]|nr:MAG: YebC/PmpR family DNA-binding transcriptional regulator [Candidatus Peribacteria bacterium]
MYYEGYGPSGVALYIKCVTSNTNRTGGNVRSCLSKM